MAVFSQEHKKLTRRLIEAVTGFEPGEENFRLCFLFAKSNFKFHRFLDVNDLNVTRAITGLKEKFEVHSQPHKATVLKGLTDNFLRLNLDNSYPHSEAHYGVILFLLSMARSPVNSDYVRREEVSGQTDCADGFDWSSHLMDGIHYQSYDTDSGSDWSDSSDQSDETTPTSSPLDDSAIGEEIFDDGGSPTVLRSKSILLDSVLTPYWDVLNPEHQVDLYSLSSHCLATLAHPACSLATEWSSYQQTVDPLHTPSHEVVTLTEWQIVRETLWACLGAELSFVYEIKGSKVNVRKHIQIVHLTPLSLRRQLEYFCRLISMLLALRLACREMTFDPSYEITLTTRQWTSCKTYEAFSSALRACLDKLESHIREVERLAIDKVCVLTLLSLEVRLTPIFSAVQEMHAVIDSVTSLHQQNPNPTPLMCSSHILSFLWTCLCHYDNLGPSGRAPLQTILPLWLATVRPHLDFIESWVVGGALNDKWEEFCIQRSRDGESAWSTCFTLCGIVPDFLQPVVDQVLQAGKSMYVIEKIGMLKEMDHPATPPTSLYEEFLASFKSELSTSHDDSHDLDYMSHDLPTHNRREWKLAPLVSKFVSTLPTKVVMETPESPSDELWRRLSSVTSDSSTLPPLHIQLQQVLSSLIRPKCLRASSSLVKFLTELFNLTDHFKTVQRFFLMGDGPVMHQFCLDIFQRIQDGDRWQDSQYLNAALHEALQGQYASSADLEQRLTVNHTPPIRPSVRPSLSSISLSYVVPWPLAMVFSQSTMTTYNQVFHLLLQVNWAKWSLESVHMRQLELTRLPSDKHRDVRLLLLLRGRLLHFVNNLINYLMTRILHSVGVEFEHNMSEATDVDAIIQLHTKYTETIFDRCLLNKKASIVKEAIMNVLCLALKFKGHWERGVANFSRANAEKIENEFSKCSHFLISCLNNTVKRGTFPHLETLAFSMCTLKTGQKLFS